MRDDTIRVRTVTREREHLVNETVTHGTVAVEKSCNRALRGRGARDSCEEEETIIVPVVEEVIFVEKKLFLKEEVHLRRERRSGPFQEVVTASRRPSSPASGQMMRKRHRPPKRRPMMYAYMTGRPAARAPSAAISASLLIRIAPNPPPIKGEMTRSFSLGISNVSLRSRTAQAIIWLEVHTVSASPCHAAMPWSGQSASPDITAISSGRCTLTAGKLETRFWLQTAPCSTI